MLRGVSVLFFFFLVPTGIFSQVLPKEGSVLHYRLIGFSFTGEKGAKNYSIQIAEGYYNSADSFKKNIVKTIACSDNRVIGEVPAFGREYTWRVTVDRGKAGVNQSVLHHFSTAIIPEVDPNVTRFRILQPAEKYKDAYVFLDGTGVLYDMNGKPVWYLPRKEGAGNPAGIQLSPHGTITFLNSEHAYEVNYNGAILWENPKNGIVSGDTSEHFHHEFVRLENGHYMVMGSESVAWMPDAFLKNDANNTMPGMQNRKVLFGTVIEYDERGNVVWSWKSSGYFVNSDLKHYVPPNNMRIVDVHENAFYFDEKNKMLYVSCKNISRVLKVKYPEGTVLNSYGETYKPGVAEQGNSMFCGQHCCRYSDDGYMYLYNNNSCNERSPLPKVIMFKEPVDDKDSLKIVWEYQCTTDGLDLSKLQGPGRSLNNPGGLPAPPGMRFAQTRGGGAVMDLPDRSMFVAMSGPYSKVFIVSRDKKVLWSALPEKWSEEKRMWDVVSQYRGTIITDRKQLERLIWNAQADR